jgi:hypothetical protein
MKICFFDYEHQKTLANFHMASKKATRGYKAKSFCVIDKHHIIASITSHELLPGNKRK